jgi:hypothetical protein
VGLCAGACAARRTSAWPSWPLLWWPPLRLLVLPPGAGTPPNKAALLQLAYAVKVGSNCLFGCAGVLQPKRLCATHTVLRALAPMCVQDGSDWQPVAEGAGRGVVVLLLHILHSGLTPKLQARAVGVAGGQQRAHHNHTHTHSTQPRTSRPPQGDRLLPHCCARTPRTHAGHTEGRPDAESRREHPRGRGQAGVRLWRAGELGVSCAKRAGSSACGLRVSPGAKSLTAQALCGDQPLCSTDVLD